MINAKGNIVCTVLLSIRRDHQTIDKTTNMKHGAPIMKNQNLGFFNSLMIILHYLPYIYKIYHKIKIIGTKQMCKFEIAYSLLIFY